MSDFIAIICVVTGVTISVYVVAIFSLYLWTRSLGRKAIRTSRSLNRPTPP